MKRYFQFDELGTNYKTEFIAGLTTFLSMAYVLFVNPATLSLGNVKGLPAGTGMDPGAVFVATALAADRFVNYGYFRKVSDCFSARYGN